MHPKETKFTHLVLQIWVMLRNSLQLYMEFQPLQVLVDDMFKCVDIALNAIVAKFL